MVVTAIHVYQIIRKMEFKRNNFRLDEKSVYSAHVSCLLITPDAAIRQIVHFNN